MDPSPPPDPAPPPPRRSCLESDVLANRALCVEHFRLTLRLASFPPTLPGQFVQLLCRSDAGSDGSDREFDWSIAPPTASEPKAFLRRPFSLAGRREAPGGTVELDIIYRVVGSGTSWLAGLTPGAGVSVLGPLGNGFAPPADGRTALLVGGGVGIPPMLYLALAWAGQPMVAFAGALRRELLPLSVTDAAALSGDGSFAVPAVAEFARHGVPSVIATDDGSLGCRGFVTDALEAYLDANPLPDPVVYACGPEPMLKRVATIAGRRGLDCQIAVERAMACGMGTCQSCCIRVRKPDPAAAPLPGSAWAWRLACTDGPVFPAREILW